MAEGQRGVALITALLVVALASIAAVAMATRQHLDVRRTGNLLHGEQAYTYLLGAESWASVVLFRDLRESQIDTLEEDWATQLPATFVEGGSVIGRITDAQALFNLNNLVVGGQADEVAVDRYKHLLEALELPIELADALVDWMDADVNVRFPDGAEDQSYLLLQPPYRTANQPLVDVSELRLIQGYEPEVVETLRPYVIALPVPTPININTAGATVLRSLAPGIAESEGASLVSARPEEGFPGTAAFLKLPELAGKEPPPDGAAVSVQSDWFLFQGEANVGQARAQLTALLYRADRGVEVVQRRRQLVRLPEPEPESEIE
ncbi:MAG: type II secretion system minor pseudopilin GspK [Gammaproteobacteria bacterium]